MMDDKLQAVRQPMVTATGIILGFMLNFLTSWMKTTSKFPGLDYIVQFFLIAGTVLLVVCLYRILRLDYPRSRAEQYYHRTLALFIVGIVLAFVGVFIDAAAGFYG